VPNCARNGNVFKLGLIGGAAEHQSAAAHVTAPDEFQWKTESLAENFLEHIDVFSSGDAAEQNNFAFCAHPCGNAFGFAQQWAAIARIVFVDFNFGKRLEQFQINWGVCVEQTAIGGDDENSRQTWWRLSECFCVSKFAAKIKSAEKAEHFTERNGFQSQTSRKIELRSLPEKHFGALTAGMSWGKEKNSMHGGILFREAKAQPDVLPFGPASFSFGHRPKLA
jgi:hypothetical protein